MRPIDADNLHDKTTTLEAQALAQCERLMLDEEALEEWKRWSAILAERSAFRCDLEREPTIDAVPVIRCRDCKWFGKLGCAVRIVDESDKPKENDFCSFAERRKQKMTKIEELIKKTEELAFEIDKNRDIIKESDCAFVVGVKRPNRKWTGGGSGAYVDLQQLLMLLIMKVEDGRRKR